MIYAKIKLKDNLLTIRCYDEMGEDITLSLKLRADVYMQGVDGNYSLLETTYNSDTSLKRLYKDLQHVYVTLTLNDVVYKKFIKTNVDVSESVLQYKVMFTTTPSEVLLSNLFLDRFNYFLPKWSAAYKNDVSVFSKLTYPYFSNIEKLFYKTSSYLDKAVTGGHEYRKYINTQSADIGSVESKDSVNLRYTFNKETSPVTSVTLTPVQEPKLFRGDSNLVYDQVSTKKSQKIYLTGPLNTITMIRGMTSNGNFVSETIENKTLSTKATKFKYKTVKEVVTDIDGVVVGNYVNCKDTHLVEEFYEIPSFTNKSKQVQFPKFTLRDDILEMIMTSQSTSEYVNATYQFEKPLKSVYVDKYGSVTGLTKDGFLVTGLLRKELEVNMPTLPSNNNNTFVYVDDVDYDTKEVSFGIDCQALQEQLDVSSVLVELQSEEGIFYLDGLTRDIVTKPVPVLLSRFNSFKIGFPFTYETSFISMTIKTEDKSFQASFRNDRIPLKQQSDLKFDSLIYTDGNLMCNVGKDFYKINLNKDYYEISEKGFAIIDRPNVLIRKTNGATLNV